MSASTRQRLRASRAVKNKRKRQRKLNREDGGGRFDEQARSTVSGLKWLTYLWNVSSFFNFGLQQTKEKLIVADQSSEAKYCQSNESHRSSASKSLKINADNEEIARKRFSTLRRLLHAFLKNFRLLMLTDSLLWRLLYWRRLVLIHRLLLPRLVGCASKMRMVADRCLAQIDSQLRAAYARLRLDQRRLVQITAGVRKRNVQLALQRWSSKVAGTLSKGRSLHLSALRQYSCTIGRRGLTGGERLLSKWSIGMREKVTLTRLSKIIADRKRQIISRASSAVIGGGGTREGGGAQGGGSWSAKLVGRGARGTVRVLKMNQIVPVMSKLIRRVERRKNQTSAGDAMNGDLCHHKDVVKYCNRRIALYRRIPLKSLSRLWGRCNRVDLPVWLRGPTLGLYAWLFDCNLSEADQQDLHAYSNLGEFFQRTLRPGVRPIDLSHSLTSPADGRVLYCGRVMNDCLEQVKGVTYSLTTFLGIDDSCKIWGLSEDSGCRRILNDPENNALYQCIVYLAPGDYHHFHSPADWTVTHRRHFPGELFSVKPSVARWLRGLFCLNERVVYTGRWTHGFFSLVAVGATNVGSISVTFDETLQTNVSSRWKAGCHYDVDFTAVRSLKTDTTHGTIASRERKLSIASEPGVSESIEHCLETREYSPQTVPDNSIPSESREYILEKEDYASGREENTKRDCSGVLINRGETFGRFSLGSTIVLIFEAPQDFDFSVFPGQRVVYGQGIGGVVK